MSSQAQAQFIQATSVPAPSTLIPLNGRPS